MAGQGDRRVRLETSKLDMLTAALSMRAEQLLDKVASDVEASWKSYIVEKHVIDTGAYLNSVHVVRAHEPLSRVISDGVNYGIHLEYGTHKMAARPCAAPAVEDVRPVFTKAMALVPGLAAKRGRK